MFCEHDPVNAGDPSGHWPNPKLIGLLIYNATKGDSKIEPIGQNKPTLINIDRPIRRPNDPDLKGGDKVSIGVV